MHTSTIVVPERLNDNIGSSFMPLIRWRKLINNESPEKIFLDFSKCKFCSPFLLADLLCILRHYKQNGVKIEVEKQKINPLLNSYLETIGYFIALEANDASNYSSQIDYCKFEHKTYLPLTLFPTDLGSKSNKTKEYILQQTGNLLKKQLGLEGEILSAVRYLVDEITVNISEHSGSEFGIIMAQYFPTKNFLDMCIADYGKGLLNSYINSGKYEPKNNSEAIEMAVNGKSTKNLPESRGFGISTSRNILAKGLRGHFLLWSGDVIFHQNYLDAKKIEIPSNASNVGVTTFMRIPILSNRNFNLYEFVR